jgi:hypothetical protein
MIYRQLLTASWTYLIIDISNVHDKVDIVSKVILQDPPDDILSQVIPIISPLTIKQNRTDLA